MHAEPGFTSERRSGTRAATTFRKLPRARPGASATAASETFMVRCRRSAPRVESPGEALGRVRLRPDGLVRRHSDRHRVDPGEAVRHDQVVEEDLAADDRPVDDDVVVELDGVRRVESSLEDEVVENFDAVADVDL